MVALLPAASEHCVSVEVVPTQVRPGDLFELRVEMNRADYAQFVLEVPTHERLHRVAVESAPVSLVDGRYRQSERWFLQADSAGEIVIDGATVLLESGSGSVPVKLSPLRVEVMAYGQQDESAEPVGLPAVPPAGVDGANGIWWWIVPGLLAILATVWWERRGKRTSASEDPREDLELDTVLAELDSGEIPSPALERMMMAQGGAWSSELREAVEAALYAGRGQARKLAAMLREEVAR